MSILSPLLDWRTVTECGETALPFLLIAPIIGSFLGVLINRIPNKQPFIMGRSRCDTCQSSLKSWEMVPIISYLRQRGQCQHCGQAITPFHLYVEIAALGVPFSLFGASLLAPPALIFDAPLWPFFLWSCLLGWCLLALCWIDLRCMRLPDSLTLPLIIIGLANGAWTDASLSGDTLWLGDTLLNRLAGCLVGWALFAGISTLYKRLKGRAGLGAGDAKLLAAGGAWLGIAALPHIILFAALLGLAHSGLRYIIQRHAQPWHDALPFGPALALAIWLIQLASG